MILKRIVWLVTGIVFVVSLAINALAFSGLLNPQNLVREKDELINRFARQVQELEEKNRRLEESERFLETKLENFTASSAAAKAELSSILDEYERLKTGGAQ